MMYKNLSENLKTILTKTLAGSLCEDQSSYFSQFHFYTLKLHLIQIKFIRRKKNNSKDPGELNFFEELRVRIFRMIAG